MGIFGGRGGNALKLIAGSIGDALLQQNGQEPIYARSRLLDQQRQFDEQRQMNTLAAEQQARQAQYDYELAHPKPVNNDTVADYEFWKGKLSPEDFQTYINSKINPPRMVTMGDGSVRFVQGGATPKAPAIGAIEDGHRFKGGNPADPNAWEAVGGAPSQGGATFP